MSENTINDDSFKEHTKTIKKMTSKVSQNESLKRLCEMFYGVLYSLRKAHQYGYNHEEDSIKVGDRVWKSKYYFNNAISRLSSLYHRILKIKFAEKLSCKGNKHRTCGILRNLYVNELKECICTDVDISLKATQKVHSEYNKIKHGIKGMTYREFKPNTIQDAFQELLKLYEKLFDN